MANKWANIKVWPLLFCCFRTGDVYIKLSHNYGTEAVLLQMENYIAIRGNPRKVYSNQGSQLTSWENYVAWLEKEAPRNWRWNLVVKAGAWAGTTWEFIPAGCQFQNGLVES